MNAVSFLVAVSYCISSAIASGRCYSRSEAPRYGPIYGTDGRCVGIDSSKDLYLYTCNANDAKQQWKFYVDGTVINEAFPHLCLTHIGPWPLLKECTGDDKQRWTFASCSNNAKLYTGDAMDKCMVLGDNRLYVSYDCATRDDIPNWWVGVVKPCKCEQASSKIPAGGACSMPLIGYENTRCSTGCCENGRCVQKKKDWVNISYCPAECRAWPFAPLGTC